jgi:hypothetical protein
MERHTNGQDDAVFDAILVVVAILVILAVALATASDGDDTSSTRNAKAANAVPRAD